MLEEKVRNDYVQAMKDKDVVRSSTLNFLRASMKNVLIDRRVEYLEDADVIAVIKKQVKQRQDSIEQYERGGRKDLVEKEQKELAILKNYLPQEFSEEELRKIINDAISETQALSMKDMGKVMKIVSGKVAGRADNAMISTLVKAALAG